MYLHCVFGISLAFSFATDSVLIAFLVNTQIRLPIKVLHVIKGQL